MSEGLEKKRARIHPAKCCQWCNWFDAKTEWCNRAGCRTFTTFTCAKFERVEPGKFDGE